MAFHVLKIFTETADVLETTTHFGILSEPILNGVHSQTWIIIQP